MEAKKAKWSPRMLDIAKNSMNHLAHEFDRRLRVDIEARDIARYQKARQSEGASGRTINIEVGCLRSVMKPHGLWPLYNVEMFPERDDAGHALTADEGKYFSWNVESRVVESCDPS
jgi:hypothetical protein